MEQERPRINLQALFELFRRNPNLIPGNLGNAVQSLGWGDTLRGLYSGAPLSSLGHAPAHTAMSGIGANPATAYIPSAGSGAIGALNTYAPAFILGTAGMTLFNMLTAPSAEKAFPSNFAYGYNSKSAPKTLPVPSSRNIAQLAGYNARKDNRTAPIDVGKAIAPTKTTDNEVFTKDNKQYVMLSGDNPLMKALSSGGITASGIKPGVDGRTAVSLNSYSRMRGAYESYLSNLSGADRGGK